MKRKGEWIIYENKKLFAKSCLLMTPCHDDKISGRECTIKLEWIGQLR